MVEDTITKLWHILWGFFTNQLFPAFISILRFLVHNRDALWVLIGIVIVLAIVKSKVLFVKSHRTLPQVIDAVNGCLVTIILIVAFFRFGLPAWDNLSNYKSTSTSSTTPTQTSTPTQNTTKTTPKTTTQPTTKQLYYTVSCSSCYASGCNHNGYYYNGLSVDNYNYYRNVCRSCSCTDFKAQSYWR